MEPLNIEREFFPMSTASVEGQSQDTLFVS